MTTAPSPAKRSHAYTAGLHWTGNRGDGTGRYDGYGRDYRIVIAGKPDLPGTADPAFRGDPDRHNPEDLFLSSIAACHMLSYLALCARHGVRVVAYDDDARATLSLDSQGGRFEVVTLHPVVTIDDPADSARAAELHVRAHELCFIASSCSVPIHCEPTIRIEGR